MTNPERQPSGEDDLIARHFRPLASDPGALGLVDDAAILKARGEDIVVTTDAVVAKRWPPGVLDRPVKPGDDGRESDRAS